MLHPQNPYHCKVARPLEATEELAVLLSALRASRKDVQSYYGYKILQMSMLTATRMNRPVERGASPCYAALGEQALLSELRQSVSSETQTREFSLRTKGFDTIGGKNPLLVLAFADDITELTAEHRSYVDAVSRLSGTTIWPDSDPPHIKLARIYDENLNPDLMARLTELIPPRLHVLPTEFLPAGQGFTNPLSRAVKQR